MINDILKNQANVKQNVRQMYYSRN